MLTASLMLAYVAYILGWNAGHTMGVIETITAEMKHAMRAPLSR